MTPRPWVSRIAVHRLVLPERQLGQLRHSGIYNGMTWSPFLSDFTSAPVSTTMPAPSCPRIAGNNPSGSAPESVNASVWQMPVALISTSTSPARGPSRSTLVTSSGSPALFAIAALTFTEWLSPQLNRAVRNRRFATLGEHLEINNARFARQRSYGDIRRHQHHAAETSRDARDSRRIPARFRMNDTRNRQRECRGAMQNELGQTGLARDLD